MCPWEGREETEEKQTRKWKYTWGHQRGGRTRECITAVGGLLACCFAVKSEGAESIYFGVLAGNPQIIIEYIQSHADREKRYLPKRWSWECWCHIQRKAARPETSVCRQSCRRDRDTWRRPSFNILTHILWQTYQGDAATSHTATQWFSWRRENANMRNEHGVKEQVKPWGVNSRQPPGHSEQLIQNLTAHFTEHNPVKYFYFMS